MPSDELSLDDLGLDLVPGRVGPGRQPKPLTAEFVRDLTESDLTIPATVPTTSPPLNKIRDRHHALARVLATGTSEGEASIVTGYSLSRISILKADPQFQQLLDFYRDTSTEVVADFRARMATLGQMAVEELSDRLEESPDDMSSGLLKDIARDMADRTGHAPARGPQVTVNVNEDLQSRIARARERLAAMPALSRVIEHE